MTHFKSLNSGVVFFSIQITFYLIFISYIFEDSCKTQIHHDKNEQIQLKW